MRLALGSIQILLGCVTLIMGAWSYLDGLQMAEGLGDVTSAHDTYFVTPDYLHYLPYLITSIVIVVGGCVLIKDHKLLGATNGSR